MGVVRATSRWLSAYVSVSALHTHTQTQTHRSLISAGPLYPLKGFMFVDDDGQTFLTSVVLVSVECHTADARRWCLVPVLVLVSVCAI